jgi:YHS domain-containing protein
MARDPVCEMQVNEDKARSEGLTVDYQHTTYFFCSLGCKQQFEKDPRLFVARKPDLR